jgi:hypothetical protein
MKKITTAILVLLFVVLTVNEAKGEPMKVSSEWKKLTQAQRRTWNAWAKSNPVLLDDGNVRRVSGRKAMTMVLRNRAVAGEALNSTVVPAAAVWVENAFNLYDAGPFTVNAGYVGLRAATVIGGATKWFVWATPPIGDAETEPHRWVRFVTCLTLAPMASDELTPDFGPAYLPVCGSWDGPGIDGAWPEDKFVWFRVHQYANGQLGPGVMLKGLIQVEL